MATSITTPTASSSIPTGPSIPSAPAPSTPTPTSMAEMIRADLSAPVPEPEPSPSPTTPVETPPSEPADETQTQETQETQETKTPESEKPEGETKPETETETAPEDLSDEDLEDQSKFVDPKSPRWKRVYAGYKVTKALSETLGIVPKAEEVSQWRTQALDHQTLLSDLSSADPNTAVLTLDRLAQALPDPQSSFISLAQALPQFLVNAGEPGRNIYNRHIALPAVLNFTQEIKSLAAQAETPEEKDLFTKTYKAIHYILSGGKRVPTDIDSVPPPSSSPQESPEARELRQLKSQIQRDNSTRVNQEWSSFLQAIDAETSQLAISMVDAALKPIEHVKSTLPKVYEATRSDFIQQVIRAIAEDQAARHEINLRAKEAQRTFHNPEARTNAKKSFVDLWKRYAEPRVSKLRAEYITQLGTSAQATAKSLGDKAKAVQHPEPRSSGSTAAQPPAPRLERQQGESDRDFMRRQIQMDLRAVSS